MRVLIFVGLKLAEIAGVAAIIATLYQVGHFMSQKSEFVRDAWCGQANGFDYVLIGFIFAGGAFVVGFVGVALVISNWQWAEKLASRKEQK